MKNCKNPNNFSTAAGISSRRRKPMPGNHLRRECHLPGALPSKYGRLSDSGGFQTTNQHPRLASPQYGSAPRQSTFRVTPRSFAWRAETIQPHKTNESFKRDERRHRRYRATQNPFNATNGTSRPALVQDAAFRGDTGRRKGGIIGRFSVPTAGRVLGFLAYQSASECEADTESSIRMTPPTGASFR
jgi:hypothetical protein